MQRPTVYILLFLFFGVLLGVGLNSVSDALDPVYGQYKYRLDHVSEHGDEIEAITVGHSHNLAIDFDALGLKGYHLWAVGTDMFEVRYFVNAVLPSLPELKVVLLPVDEFAFSHDNELFDPGLFVRWMYYAVTPAPSSPQLIHGDFKGFLVGKLSGIARRDHWKGVFRAAWRRLRKQGEVSMPERYGITDDGLIRMPHEKNMVGVSETPRLAELKMYIRFVSRAHKLRPDLTGDVFNALVELVERLHSNNIPLILYSTPVFRTYKQLLQRENTPSLTATTEYVGRLLKTDGVQFYDLAQDTTFSHHPEFFYDEDHLNAVGARAFSLKLRREIENCGLGATVGIRPVVHQ